MPETERAIGALPAEFAWQPAEKGDLQGLFESVSIEGEAAAQLWRVYYHFAEDGTYTGAALVIGGERPEFQTLSGQWDLHAGALDLGDGSRIAAFAATDHVKLETDGGSVVLRRAAIQ
jgi:hypothetical protein